MSHAQSASFASSPDTIIGDTTPHASAFKRHASKDGPPPTTGQSFVPQTIVPPDHPFRTLVLCFDGTGDQFDSDNSNIVTLFSMLKKDDRAKQMVYYQAGIGTYTTPQIATPFWSGVQKTLDSMVASNLDAHVMDGYEFLMQNYTAGDRICIFGFSRGAYTARALAGMVHKVGLLPACNHQQVPFAYKMFTRGDEVGWAQSNGFKKAFSIDVDIEFIGVWDTVCSVGLIPHRLPFTASNTAVKTFRHAVSLDERRAKFKANLWNRLTPHEESLGLPVTSGPATATREATIREDEEGHRHKESLRAMEEKWDKPRDLPTDVEEVWFSGCHCDVGGGSVTNDTPHALARIPLRWMIRECFKTKTGILFDADQLRDIGLDPACLYPVVLPRPPPLPVGNYKIRSMPKGSALGAPELEEELADQAMEEQEELNDALSPVYDQLSLAPHWWLLEVIIMRHRYQRKDNTWASAYGMNLGRPRYIPGQKTQGLKVHRSVKMRMEAEHEDGSGKYKPRTEFTVEPTWID